MLRPPRRLAAVAALVAAAFACADDGSDDTTSPEAPAVTARTTTEAAPASSATAVTAAGPPEIELVPAADIPAASGVADLPGPGPVLVSTLEGNVLAVDLDDGSSEVVLDLTGVVSAGGERGLFDVAVDPGGERVYVNFTDAAGDTEIRSWPLVDGRPDGGADDGVVHLEIRQPFANHNGGNLEFGPDGALWIGTGDGGSAGDPDNRAQNATDLLGKMLRVVPDPAGGVQAPDDNPDAGGRAEVWAVGLRNPWRYSFDSATGLLWIADVGQNAVEEVSVIDPGSVPADQPYPNFGWNLFEGDAEFSGPAPDNHVPPAVTYRHADTGGCSITGGHVYRGEAVESLVGWYVFGDLCGGWLRAVPSDEPATEPVEVAAEVGRVLSIETLEDGELLVLTEAGVLRVVSG